MNLNRVGELRQRNVTFTAADQSFLELSSRDDFTAMCKSSASPPTTAPATSGIQYRALGYPDRKYSVILMGGDSARPATSG